MWEHFWWGVGFTYLALLLLALDFCFEVELKNFPKVKRFLILIITVVFIVFTFKVVLASSPLGIQVADYGSGIVDESGKIGDVLWKSNYHDVRVFIDNPTASDYTDLVLWVSTDLYIAHVGRFGKCLDGSVEPATVISDVMGAGPDGVVREQSNVEGPIHIPITPPILGYDEIFSFGTYAPVWKVQCDKIRKKDSIELLLAVVSMDKQFNLLKPKKPLWVDFDVEYESLGHRHRQTKIRLPVRDRYTRPWQGK